MRILVFEYVTGGGLFSAAGSPQPAGSLLAEGQAMARAIVADLLALPEAEIWTTRDARLAPLHPAGCNVTEINSAREEVDLLPRLAIAADWTMLIAPETNGALFQRARLVEMVGGRLLSPSSTIVEIAANKQLTADWLTERHITVPAGHFVNPGDLLPVPYDHAVIKPIDGCGSQDVRLVSGPDALKAALAALDRPMRLERFAPGLASSVAVLCGPQQQVALPACEQRLTSDGRFTYLGGRTPLAPDLDRRARRLASDAVKTLPAPLGYIGVDLILSEAADGSGDCVIEINPRLTTSYVGLRAACRGNLAAAMLAIAAGHPATLSFRSQPIEFAADGTILSPAAV